VTGQEKAGPAAGVKRQYLGCAGKAANGINTGHLPCVRDKTGYARWFHKRARLARDA
jgi:hypothetical protein